MKITAELLQIGRPAQQCAGRSVGGKRTHAARGNRKFAPKPSFVDRKGLAIAQIFPAHSYACNNPRLFLSIVLNFLPAFLPRRSMKYSTSYGMSASFAAVKMETDKGKTWQSCRQREPIGKDAESLAEKKGPSQLGSVRLNFGYDVWASCVSGSCKRFGSAALRFLRCRFTLTGICGALKRTPWLLYCRDIPRSGGRNG
jgi:hypothetical protein